MIEAPINTRPLGMLGLLDIQSMGINPRTLGNVVQPQIDMGQFYLQGRMLRRVDTAVIGIGTPGNVTFSFTGNLLVPRNQLWWVEMWSVQIENLAAGDLVNFGLGFFPDGLGGSSDRIWLPSKPVGSQSTALNGINVQALDHGCWIPPSSELVVIANSRTVTVATSAISQLRYVPVQIAP